MIQLSPGNAAALQARAPDFLRWLEHTAPPEVRLSPHGNEQALMVDGVHLASAFEPEAEASLAAKHGIPSGTEEAFVYGTGRAMVEAALERAARVTVVGVCARASLAAFAHDELAWLNDPRVTLRTPDQEARPRRPRVICTAELRLAEPSPLRDSLLLELVENRQFEVFQGRLAERVQQGSTNRARFPDDPGVRGLFQTGKPMAVVAAGGPSLPECLKLLAPRRDEVTLISVTTALASLEAAGLVPDLVVAVDPKATLVAHLDAMKDLGALAQVPLVYALDVATPLLERWPGPRRAARLSLSDYSQIEPETDFGTLYCSGTVTHSAVDLAIRMGAADVVLAGVDFGHPGGQSHTPDAPFVSSPAQTHLDVIDVQGGIIPTSLNLLGYLRDLEDYIAQQPGVRFWNASPSGARIAGTERYAG